MSRSKTPPSNKKAIQCPDCGMWVTLQGYGGHQRFYHGKYQEELKSRLFQQLLALRRSGKISKEQLEMLTPLVGDRYKATIQELKELQNTINIFWSN